MITKQHEKLLHLGPWIKEESAASFFLMDHLNTCYIDSARIHKKKLFRTCVYSLENSYAHEWTSQKDAEGVLRWLLNNCKRDSRFLEKKDTFFSRIHKETRQFSDNVQQMQLQDTPDAELLALFVKASMLSKKQYGYSIITEAADALTDLDYRNALPNVPIKQLLNVIRTLSLPAHRAIINECHSEIDSLALLLQKRYKNKIPSSLHMVANLKIRTMAERIRRLYYWSDNSFKVAKSLSAADMYLKARDKATELSAKDLHLERRTLIARPKKQLAEQRRILQKYAIQKDGRTLFALIRYLSALQDRRKELVLRFGSTIRIILNEVMRRKKISRKEIDYYLRSDITRLLLKGIRVPQSKIRERHKTIAIGYYHGRQTAAAYYFGKEVDRIVRILEKDEKGSHEKELHGFVASVGTHGNYVRGKVKIILDPHRATLTKGDILVTGMTRPEFVPLMKKAKAVITNEGGITTHAAIISRELKIPCIIGTKYATSALRNGDTIHMDLNKGIIQKIRV